MTRLLLLVGLLSVAGCPPSETCTALETRCRNEVAEICGDDQYWQPMEDCTRVTANSGQPFSCCFQAGDDAGLPAGHTCVLTSQCGR